MLSVAFSRAAHTTSDMENSHIFPSCQSAWNVVIFNINSVWYRMLKQQQVFHIHPTDNRWLCVVIHSNFSKLTSLSWLFWSVIYLKHWFWLKNCLSKYSMLPITCWVYFFGFFFQSNWKVMTKNEEFHVFLRFCYLRSNDVLSNLIRSLCFATVSFFTD